MNRYRQLAKLFEMVSADNGGCTADEIEAMLAHCSDHELTTLAAGEDREQETVKAALRERFDDGTVEALDQLLNIAFQGPLPQ